MQAVQPSFSLQNNNLNISRKNTVNSVIHPVRRTLKKIRRQEGSRHLILNICDYWGFSQHEGECWVDTIQQIFFFADGLKELTQPLFYKITDEELHRKIEEAVRKGIIQDVKLHRKIEEAVRKGIIQDVKLTPTRSTFLPMVGGDPFASTNVMPSAASMAIQNAIDKKDIEKIKTLLYSNKDQYNLDGLLLYFIRSDIRSDISEQVLQSICQVLLDIGADANTTYKDGNTALILAASKGNKSIVQSLLTNGANVNAQTEYGWTALIHAAYYGDESIVQLLLTNGANVNAQNKDGWTALIVAASEGYKSIVELLLTNGANVNAQHKHGDTALIYAADYGDESIVQLLLTNGANVNAQTEDGDTALSIAIRKNYLKIIELLTKSTNAPFIASSVTPNIRAPPKEDSSLASIIEEGIKAMRDRFKNHYDIIVHKKEEECLRNGPQQIKQMYKSSVAGPILLKRMESKRLGPAVAAGLQAEYTQQERLNTGKAYSSDTAGGYLSQELAVNNLLFRMFDLPFRAVWLVTALASKAPIHAIGVIMSHIDGTTQFGEHATGFLKCKGVWYYYNDNNGLFNVSPGFINALQTALNFNDGQIHPSICIKTIEDRCYLLSLNNVKTIYKYSKDKFSQKQGILGNVTPNQIWTETGWVSFKKWKGANASEAIKIETTVIMTDRNKKTSYYNLLYGAYSIVKYDSTSETAKKALFDSAINTGDISYIDTLTHSVDPNMIVDPTTKMTLLMWGVKNGTNIQPFLNNLIVNPNLQDKNGRTALIWGVIIGIDIQPFLNNSNVNLNLQDKDGMTALMWGARTHTDIQPFLNNSSVNLNLQDKNGMTALMHLIQVAPFSHNDPRIFVKSFIENPHIDLTIKTKGNMLGFNKKSALDFAKETNYQGIIDLVQNALAPPKSSPPSSSRTRKRSLRRQKRTRRLRKLRI